MNQIKAPWSLAQVKALIDWQTNGMVHPFTCIGQVAAYKKDHETVVDRSRENCPNQGILLPTESGWVCPCGKYRQDWAHDFMMEDTSDDIIYPKQ